MGVMIPPELIKDIKRANPLEDVLKDYGIKIGSDGKAMCQFHKDTSPSMHIYSEKDRADDSYYCFVCEAGTKGVEHHLPDGTQWTDKGSDVIAFIQNKEKLEDWRDAVRYLGARVGITVPEEKPDPEAQRMKTERTNLNREFYHALVADQDAMNYLAERDVDLEDIKRWRLGMVPWNWKNKAYAGRIVFGMTEVSYQPDQAKTIAMGYRVRELNDYAKHGYSKDDIDQYLHAKYDEDGDIKSFGPKYYNDPESRIYKKKQFLYGLNQAIPFIKKYGFAVIMEGYMDVIASHKHGLPVSVASCGTAITEDQVKLLARYTKKVFLWLDADNAGKAAMRRALPLLLRHGFDVLIVETPSGLDPADVAKMFGNLQNYIRYHSKPAVQQVIEQVSSRYDAVINKARVDALEELLPLIDEIARPADKVNYKAVLETKFGVRI